jgi:hypothetical protein
LKDIKGTEREAANGAKKKYMEAFVEKSEKEKAT